jgi:hypothetical protein
VVFPADKGRFALFDDKEIFPADSAKLMVNEIMEFVLFETTIVN